MLYLFYFLQKNFKQGRTKLDFLIKYMRGFKNCNKIKNQKYTANKGGTGYARRFQN